MNASPRNILGKKKKQGVRVMCDDFSSFFLTFFSAFVT